MLAGIEKVKELINYCLSQLFKNAELSQRAGCKEILSADGKWVS